jgi:hypothetical protein
VGTGYGYQTALLAILAREVWSIELWQDMTKAARASLAAVGLTNVTLLVGDGTRGLPEQARRSTRSSSRLRSRACHRRWQSSSSPTAGWFSRSAPAASRRCACSLRIGLG